MKKLTMALVTASILATSAVAAFAADVTYQVKKATAPVKADGDLKEFAGAPVITMTLPDGGAVKAQVLWDEKALYFGFTVADGTQSNPASGGNIWQGDNVQIALDPGNEKNEGGYDENDYEFGFALTDDNGLECHAWKLADGVEFDAEAQTYSITNKGGVTTYEIVLPAAQIAPTKLAKGSVFGANLLVNDDDGSGREFIEWTPGIGAGKNPAAYNDFKLVD